MGETNMRNLVKKHKILVFGIIVFCAGVAMWVVPSIFLSTVSLCKNYNESYFVPNTVVTVTCPVVRDVGQDLTFRANFYTTAGAKSIQIPAHLEIRDPTNTILYDMNFDDKIIISFKPKVYGNYTATVTSLEDENNRIHRGDTRIVYALGFLTFYKDVYNPLGNAVSGMIAFGGPVYLLGLGIIIYGIIKAVRRK